MVTGERHWAKSKDKSYPRMPGRVSGMHQTTTAGKSSALPGRAPASGLNIHVCLVAISAFNRASSSLTPLMARSLSISRSVWLR